MIAADGGALTVRRRLQRIVLTALLFRANQPVTVDRLLELVWDGRPPESAVANLRNYLSALRRVLRHGDAEGAERILAGPDGYRLRVERGEFDAALFDQLADDGREALGDRRYPIAIERLTRALGLWRGPVLAGLTPPVHLQAEIARLDQLRLAVLEDSVDARLAVGQHEELVPELEALTARHGLRERIWAQRMLALYRSGRQGDALSVYRQVYALLAGELGTDPGPRLQELHRQILTADPALHARSASGPVPAPATRAVVPAQLPADSAAFTGRHRELAELGRLSAASTVVISAIDGMAGVGKTALVVHTAHQLAKQFPDGQLFVDLHGFTQGVSPVDPAEALDRMLRSLGVRGEQIPAHLDDRAALYRTTLAGTRTLIVLDNAATESQVVPLLPGTPGCVALVTSRCRLTGLEATRTMSLDVLPRPDAVTLLTRGVGAARLAGEAPSLIDELVELCGRLPLAISIAAARLRARPAWTVAHLTERLRGQQHRLAELDGGQRSVTATLDLSYQHLTAPQQRLYQLLGLHPGPTVDAYAAAALAGISVARTERLLDDLLATHLLQEPAPGRYLYHDLVRAHAVAAGGESGPDRDAAFARLCDHYAHLTSVAMDLVHPHDRDRRPWHAHPGTATPQFDGQHQAETWLDTELDNLLTVAGHAATHGRPEHTLHQSAALQRHLRIRGRRAQARTLHDVALGAARATGDRAGELTALTSLGDVHRQQGRYEPALDCYEQAARIAGAICHRVGESDALTGAAWVRAIQGQHAAAADSYARALEIARRAGHHSSEVTAQIGLGHVHRMQGEFELATHNLTQALGIARDDGDRLNALDGLGDVLRMQGRHKDATDCLEQALRLSREIGHRVGELSALTGLGHSYRHQGQYETAAHHLGQALQLARELGDRNWQFEALQGIGRVHHALGHPRTALQCHHYALDIARELGQPTDQARAYDGLAHAHQALGQPELARQHWQHALDTLTEVGADHTYEEQVSAATLRDQLNQLLPAAR